MKYFSNGWSWTGEQLMNYSEQIALNGWKLGRTLLCTSHRCSKELSTSGQYVETIIVARSFSTPSPTYPHHHWLEFYPSGHGASPNTCLCVILPQLLLIALTFKPRKFLNSLTCEVYHPSFWWFHLYNLCRETKLQSFYCLKGRPYGFGLDKKNPQYIDFLHNINSTNNGCIFFIYLTARSITTWNIDGTYNPRQKNNKLYALVKNQISWDGNTGEPVYFEGFTLRREEPSKPADKYIL